MPVGLVEGGVYLPAGANRMIASAVPSDEQKTPSSAMYSV